MLMDEFSSFENKYLFEKKYDDLKISFEVADLNELVESLDILVKEKFIKLKEER